jgi:tRNA-modifying protein YgfZ
MPGPPIVTKLASRALIAVNGEDWRGFLQGLLTQDVERIGPGEARFGALLTPQGRLLFDLFIIGREDGCWLDCVAERRGALLQRLMIYRLRAKVTIVADDTAVFAAWGDAPAGEGWIVDPRLPDLGWRGYGVVAEPHAPETEYNRHRLSLGVPGPADWGEESSYPLEADFDLLNGVDFKKGCFVGQETTSRMKRRGVIKSRMLPIEFEGAAPEAGVEILAATLRAGEVLSGIDGRAMALVRLDRIEGAALTVDGRPCAIVPPEWLPSPLFEGGGVV